MLSSTIRADIAAVIASAVLVLQAFGLGRFAGPTETAVASVLSLIVAVWGGTHVRASTTAARAKSDAKP